MFYYSVLSYQCTICEGMPSTPYIVNCMLTHWQNDLTQRVSHDTAPLEQLRVKRLVWGPYRCSLGSNTSINEITYFFLSLARDWYQVITCSQNGHPHVLYELTRQKLVNPEVKVHLVWCKAKLTTARSSLLCIFYSLVNFIFV